MPYYNVLKQGYSSLGYKHTEETKKLLSELAKNRTHSDRPKGLIARAVTGENNPKGAPRFILLRRINRRVL